MTGTLEQVVDALVDSYDAMGDTQRLTAPCLPSMKNVARLNEELRTIIFPGVDGQERIEPTALRASIETQIRRISEILSDEIVRSFCYRNNGADPEGVREEATALVEAIIALLPNIRAMLHWDVAAAYHGDPAAKSHAEVLLAYPGLEAIMIHRVAYELWIRNVPLVPRMMSEHVHGKTGVDIHPGATIGKNFFIDHATGVVIGETTIIGDNVKVYQGVTLGALSVRKSEANKKRHPTIEDNVTIYSGATILGGDTVIGCGSIIGGNVWIIQSVPPNSKVYNRLQNDTTPR